MNNETGPHPGHDPAPSTHWSRGVGHVVRRGVPVIVLAAVAVAVYFYWQQADHRPQLAGRETDEAPVPVEVVTLRSETAPVEMKFLGQTEASLVVEIRARVAGHLIERSFTEGELVEPGQKLFQIDPRPFEVQLAQAEAQLASALARRGRAQQQVNRLTELAANNAVSAEELEEAQTALRVAAADVQVQQAAIDAVKLQLEYASIDSPIRGLIGQALKDIGSYIDAGANSHLATVHQVDPMYVRYFITELDILRFREGVEQGRISAPDRQDVEIEISLSDGSVYPHRGRINFLDVQISPETGTSVVRGSVPNPDGRLIPGQFVYARILGIQRVNVLRVPRHAVMQSPTGARVYVVNEDQQVEARPVTLGPWSEDGLWIVESGLRPGEQVIVNRLLQVRPGMTVAATAVPADTPAPESIGQFTPMATNADGAGDARP